MRQNLNEERYIHSSLKLPENGVVAEYFSPVMRLTYATILEQGMCIGIRDAFNGLEIRFVINQEADSSLLESYTDERIPRSRLCKDGRQDWSNHSNEYITFDRRLRASNRVRGIAINCSKTGIKFYSLNPTQTRMLKYRLHSTVFVFNRVTSY